MTLSSLRIVRNATITSVTKPGSRMLWRRLQLALRVVVAATLSLLVAAVHADVVTEIVQKNRQAIAFLKVTYEEVPGEATGTKVVNGTGFIVDKVGHLLTARHVVMPEFTFRKRTIEVYLGERGGSVRYAEPIDDKPKYDLALLKLTSGTNNYNHVLIGDPQSITEGTHLTALGFPLGEQGAGGVSNNDGRLSSKYGHPPGTWQTNIPLNPGDSGGPVFEDSNTVVGIVIGGATTALRINAIIPIDYASGLLPGPLGSTRVPGPSNVGELEPPTTTITGSTTLDSLPVALRTAPPAGTPDAIFDQELRKKGVLRLDGATLTIPFNSVDRERTLAVHTLVLTRRAKIVTNGMNLRIVARRIVVDEGLIASFDAEEARAAVPGGRGRDAGRMYLVGLQEITGLLPVALDGQAGADGTAGPPGAHGAAGRRGDSGADALLGCLRGGGNGEAGHQGGQGGQGFAGGDGGKGGVLVLQQVAAGVSTRITFTASGGAPGRGGPGGAGGLGGPGGEGGSRTTFCGAGGAGPDGAPGGFGQQGPNGTPGDNGRLDDL